jgi:hypothetical protein
MNLVISFLLPSVLAGKKKGLLQKRMGLAPIPRFSAPSFGFWSISHLIPTINDQRTKDYRPGHLCCAV